MTQYAHATRSGRIAALIGALLTCALVVFVGPRALAAPSDPGLTITTLTNEERAAAGAEPVQYSDALAAVAQKWAEKLAAEGKFEHNPNYTAEIPAGWSAAGENIAMATNGTPEQLQQMWVDSPGHYANMVNPDFNVMGVGWIVADDGSTYGVEVFAKYDPLPDDVKATAVGGSKKSESAAKTSATDDANAEGTTEATTEEVSATDSEPSDADADAAADTTAGETAETTDPTATATTATATATPATATATPTAAPLGIAWLADTGARNVTKWSMLSAAAVLAGVSLLLFAIIRRRRRAS